MLRRIAVLVLSLLLLAAPAIAVTDAGNPAVTRLWNNGRFICTAFYLDMPAPYGHAWIGSVQHCTQATWAARTAWDTKTEVRWINSEPWNNAGAVVGLVKDDRPLKRYVQVGNNPHSMQEVYIHGFGQGMETISRAIVFEQSTIYPDSWLVIHVTGAQQEPGSSGSPVFDSEGRLVGFLWGGLETLYLITPVEQTRAAMEHAAANPPAVEPVVLPGVVIQGP